MNKLVNTLNKMGGRFATLVVNRAKGKQTYSARIEKVSDTGKTVTFFDINNKSTIRVPSANIAFARSGKTQYRKARAR